jgi:hypothetical protein
MVVEVEVVAELMIPVVGEVEVEVGEVIFFLD